MDQRRFISRKNEVVLLNGNVVVKSFKDTKNFDIEYQMLALLSGFLSPKIIETKDNSIKMEYVKGDLLLDRYLCADTEEGALLGKMLGNSVEALFCRMQSKIAFDENFRNYIVCGDSIFRVDFEETKQGKIEEWCAKIVSFAILYSAPFETKISFINSFIEEVCITRDEFLNLLQEEIVFLSARWGVDLNNTDYFFILNDLMSKWKRQGKKD